MKAGLGLAILGLVYFTLQMKMRCVISLKGNGRLQVEWIVRIAGCSPLSPNAKITLVAMPWATVGCWFRRLPSSNATFSLDNRTAPTFSPNFGAPFGRPGLGGEMTLSYSSNAMAAH